MSKLSCALWLGPCPKDCFNSMKLSRVIMRLETVNRSTCADEGCDDKQPATGLLFQKAQRKKSFERSCLLHAKEEPQRRKRTNWRYMSSDETRIVSKDNKTFIFSNQWRCWHVHAKRDDENEIGIIMYKMNLARTSRLRLRESRAVQVKAQQR